MMIDGGYTGMLAKVFEKENGKAEGDGVMCR